MRLTEGSSAPMTGPQITLPEGSLPAPRLALPRLDLGQCSHRIAIAGPCRCEPTCDCRRVDGPCYGAGLTTPGNEGGERATARAIEEATRAELSPIHCTHANEVPAVCPCSAPCYCHAHTCKDLEQAPQERLEQVAMGLRCRALGCATRETWRGSPPRVKNDRVVGARRGIGGWFGVCEACEPGWRPARSPALRALQEQHARSKAEVEEVLRRTTVVADDPPVPELDFSGGQRCPSCGQIFYPEAPCCAERAIRI